MTDKPQKAAKATADQVTMRVTALGPVRHDDVTYAEGQEIVLPAAAAEALLRSGVVETV